MTTWTDGLIGSFDRALRAAFVAPSALRPVPRATETTAALTDSERRLSAGLMRVNHVGEVCAQALYAAQAASTTDPVLRDSFEAAAREEADHLAWTAARLDDLGARPSLLNPLWYAGSFALGWLAGRAGDAVSLGFVVETERQVEEHLAGHLERLPAGDHASRAIVEAMRRDEAEHAAKAESAGASQLPRPVTAAMRGAARVMTSTAYWI